MIANCLTPYRAHLHELIVAGVPELKLHTLITHDDADFKWAAPIPDAINVTHLGRKGESPLAGTFHSPLGEWQKGGRLIEYLRDHHVGAVICFGYRYISYLRLIRYCHAAGVPLFVNTDSNIRSEARLPPVKSWLKRQSYSWWLKRSAGVMPMGRLGEDFFRKYGADSRRFYRLPYTPDYEAFATVRPDQLQRFRQQHRLCGGRRILLFSGRLAPVKRVDLLIAAFASVAGERPEWDLLIAGDGPLRDELQRAAARLGSRVVWTGFLEQDELKLAYHSADVLVLPSDREPWAVVVQEAMAAGLAVVASDVVGAADELVADGRAGRIFAAGDVEALRQALLDVTGAERIDEYKQRARDALWAWREKLDPVAEVRRALADAGVLAK